jgi:hypothetical protein
MIETTFDHDFRHKLRFIIESGQSQAVVLSGNVHDLFYVQPEFSGDTTGQYVNLTNHLRGRWGNIDGFMLIVYKLNGAIQFMNEKDQAVMKNAWIHAKTGMNANDLAIERMNRTPKEREELEEPEKDFNAYLDRSIGKPSVALHVLREFCNISRRSAPDNPLSKRQLIILVERIDMIIPEAPITQLSEGALQRVMLCQDWFSDPEFMHGKDSVILIAEHASQVNRSVMCLPQVMTVEIPPPDTKARRHFIEWFEVVRAKAPIPLWDTKETLAAFTAGLSLQALHQLLIGAIHNKSPVSLHDVIVRVKTYIESQLGEGVVEFKQPTHTLKDVVGNNKIKKLFHDELFARMRSSGKDAITGIGVSGPIGGGKTFTLEAIVAELGMPVLIFKNIRSQWFGQTDVILEKIERVLISLQKVAVFIDEADTVFGGLGKDTHETEKRLTGRFQGWMSDVRFRGKILWFLITARIHLLSPDMRRPERLGIIFPILDPEKDERDEFIEWAVKPIMDPPPNRDSAEFSTLKLATEGYSAAAFSSLRSELTALKIRHPEAGIEQVKNLAQDQLQPDIGDARRYQVLHALMNTTRASLCPNPETVEADRTYWTREIFELESTGIR